mgnify:CR=1 FL=1
MSAPVVDHAKRAVIQDIKTSSPFNIFNIVAIVAILVIGYFLYKKFTEKFQSGAIHIPEVKPQEKAVPIAAVAEPPAEPDKSD